MNDKISLLASLSANKPNTLRNEKTPCPFCSFDVLAAEGMILKHGGQMLWVKNKFPILDETQQTLIIETDNCRENLATFTAEYANNLFDFAFLKRKKC